MASLFPEYTFASVIAIDQKIFRGKKLLIFDIDNTLFFPESTEIPPETLQWFRSIRKKYCCICVSNSYTIKKRGQRIRALLGADIFLSKYKKPSKRLFTQIMKTYHVQPKGVVVIGDMRFTDVLFGTRNHATTVLVSPLGKEKLLSLKILRRVENILITLASPFLKPPSSQSS